MLIKKKSTAIMSLGALGIVFGDIGTSPLYALQSAFGLSNHHIAISKNNVFGVLSLIIWSVFMVVTVKYVSLIMKANNEGEGGIMALVALVKRHIDNKRLRFALILFGVIGVCLFYGDGVITPAISVLSAVEGLKVVAPSLSSLVIPLALILLTMLFFVQKYGTAAVSHLFGPIMLLWFVTIASGGLYRIWQYPESLVALSPVTAIAFITQNPVTSFFAMTAVVLAITGVEALYADLGHFGIKPIKRAWFFVVFPSLVLCYIGQGTLLVHFHTHNSNLLIKLFPSFLQFSVLILSTIATIIASQSVITGMFSITKQAIQLDFLPKMSIKHTSKYEIGQIYIPIVNFLLFLAVITLVIVFGSSAKLANSYGIAVSGTIAIDTILFFWVIRYAYKKYIPIMILTSCIIFPIDLVFVSSNLQKILNGGIYPLVFAAISLLLIKTWTRGEEIVAAERTSKEESFETFMHIVRSSKSPIKRTKGSAIYITQHSDNVPLALENNTNQFKSMPEHLVIVSIKTSSHAHIEPKKRAIVDDLGYNDGISHINLYYGYKDQIDLPNTLKSIRNMSPELNFNPDESTYYVSTDKVMRSRRHNLSRWRKTLYLLMSRNELSDTDFYKLPIDRTEEFSSLISL